MATEIGTAKDDQFILISVCPDVCKTPSKPKGVPVPYPITHKMDESEQVSPNVFFRGKGVFLHNESYVDNVNGDEPGRGGGLVSGVNVKISHSKTKSKSVFINGQPSVRTLDAMLMNWKKP